MPQLTLIFNDFPIPETHLWEQFNEEHQRAVLEILSRLLIQATLHNQQEKTNE